MPIFEKVKYKKEREIKIFNIPICHYGESDYQFHRERYFELFPKSYFKQTMNIIYQHINKKYDLVFICRVNAIGESYLLNYLYKEIANKNKSKNYCIIIHNKNYIPVFRMFSDIPLEYINIDKALLNASFNKREFKFKGIKFNVFQCTHKEIDDLFINKYAKNDYKVPYPEQIRIWAGASKYNYLPMTFTQDDKNIIKKLKNINLDNFVFLSSNAKSVLPISDNFWNNLKAAIRAKGYDIVENTINFTFPQAVYVASLAKHIITMRSGISELFSTLNVPQHIVYTKHRFSPLSVEKTREVHSLKHYPFVNTYLIYEYEYNNNDNDLIQQIIERL